MTRAVRTPPADASRLSSVTISGRGAGAGGAGGELGELGAGRFELEEPGAGRFELEELGELGAGAAGAWLVSRARIDASRLHCLTR